MLEKIDEKIKPIFEKEVKKVIEIELEKYKDINRMKYQKYHQKQREAILNDRYRKKLFKILFDLYANALPIVKKVDGTVICSYSDEVEELADKIKELIRISDNQVFGAHS